MPDADETIITKFIVEADKALIDLSKLGDQIEALKELLQKTAEANRTSMRAVAKEIKENFKAEQLKPFVDEWGKVGDVTADVEKRIEKFGRAVDQALGEVNQEAKQFVQVMNNLRGINLASTRVQFEQTRDATVGFLNAMRGAHQATQPFGERIRNFTSSLSQLGQVGRFVFGTVFGIGAVQAIRGVINVFKEAINISLEFQQSLFTLEVAIRGLQRVGLDTTIAGWDRRLQDLKKQFPIFSRKEFVDAASLAALMTREFGFTEEQIADLVRQSAILSEITGKDLNEAVRGITFAIGSGYFESLQRAGVNISRQVVANEALAQGYEGVYNELEPVIRASVTYSVIQNNLNAIQEDAGKIVETTAGQVRNLRARWEDFLVTLGLVITETNETKESVEGLAQTLELLTEFLAIFGEAEVSTVPIFEQIFGPGGLPLSDRELENFNKHFREFLDLVRELRGIREPILDDFISEDAIDALQSITVGGVEFSEEDYQEIVDATMELQEEIIDIEEEANKSRIDAIADYQNDIEDLQEDHKQRLLDIEQKYHNRLDSINLKESQRIADAIADNAFRTSEVIRKAQFRKEDAERKFRERELKAERKFQEKLRQLRENFLLDLEDAVRERDARQIIRLTRQYNLRREQITREEKLNKVDRSDQFQEELRQIERQKQERLRQLAVEHQRRLDSIARQAQRERDQAKIDWERQQAEEKERAFEAQQKRSDRLNEQLEKIRESSQEKITEIIKGLQEEFDLSQQQLDAIALLYEQTYGPDGRVDRAIEYTIARLAQLAAMMAMLKVQRMQQMTFIPPGFTPPGFAGEQAEGGTIIAKKPTVAIFGEAGPEMATFTPLNKLADTSPFGGQAPVGARDSMLGRLRLEMLLSPDLEARITDNTLNEVADTIFKIEREKR
jgi:hypothetical protein